MIITKEEGDELILTMNQLLGNRDDRKHLTNKELVINLKKLIDMIEQYGND